MTYELDSDSRKLTNFIYLGQRELRRACTEYYRFLFKELEFTEQFRYVENNDKLSKIHIEAAYPEDFKRYPRIIIETVPMTVGMISFKDISKRDAETGDLWFSGQHTYTVTTRIRDYAPDPVEIICDHLMCLLSVDIIRVNFIKWYGVYIDMSKMITPGVLSEVTLPGTNQIGYETSFRMDVFEQWEAKLPAPDIEIIASEAVLPQIEES